jgi:hypothetical protein
MPAAMFPAGIRTSSVSRSSLLPMGFVFSSSLNIFKEHERIIRRVYQLLLLVRRSSMGVKNLNYVLSATTATATGATSTATAVSNNDPEVNLGSSCHITSGCGIVFLPNEVGDADVFHCSSVLEQADYVETVVHMLPSVRYDNHTIRYINCLLDLYGRS